MISFRILLASALLGASAFFISCGGDSGERPDIGWKYLGEIPQKSGQTVSIYIDTDNIEVEDNIRKFWIKYVERNPDDETDTGYVRQIGYWEVDCFDRKLFRLKEEYYSPESKLIGSTEERMEEKYEGDQSLGARMSYAACRYAGRY